MQSIAAASARRSATAMRLATWPPVSTISPRNCPREASEVHPGIGIPRIESETRTAQIGEVVRSRGGRHQDEAAMGRTAATRRVMDRRRDDAQHVAKLMQCRIAAALPEQEIGVTPAR